MIRAAFRPRRGYGKDHRRVLEKQNNSGQAPSVMRTEESGGKRQVGGCFGFSSGVVSRAQRPPLLAPLTLQGLTASGPAGAWGLSAPKLRCCAFICTGALHLRQLPPSPNKSFSAAARERDCLRCVGVAIHENEQFPSEQRMRGV